MNDVRTGEKVVRVPLGDVADIVAELVFHDLVELDPAAAKGRAVFAAEDVFDRVADTPRKLPEKGEGTLRVRLQ